MLRLEKKYVVYKVPSDIFPRADFRDPQSHNLTIPKDMVLFTKLKILTHENIYSHYHLK